MSGVEVAGLFLGAIPLVLQAFDRSERTMEFFRTFGRYTKYVTKFDSLLGAQKSLFRNNCIKLLTAITSDSQRAHVIVNMPVHGEDWTDQALRQRLSSSHYLTETVQCCERVIALIQWSLQPIASELESFRTDVEREPNVSNSSFRAF